MKSLAWLPLLALLVAAAPAYAGWVRDGSGNFWWVDDVQPNAYGLGVNKDNYGRPHQYKDEWGHTDPLWRVERNAYGLGVHKNQYGQPVYDDKWP